MARPVKTHKDRCPKCAAVCLRLLRREGTQSVPIAIPGWAYCREHGPVKL